MEQTKHQINLPEAEINMLISSYEVKLNKLIVPLQRYETGIIIQTYLADEKNLRRTNSFWRCEPVKFKNRMADYHNYVVDKAPDPLTDVVYTRRFRNSSVFREWYLTEIRHRYNEIYARITQLAQFVGYDYSHLVGQLNFSDLEQASMDWYLERNARPPLVRGGV